MLTHVSGWGSLMPTGRIWAPSTEKLRDAIRPARIRVSSLWNSFRLCWLFVHPARHAAVPPMGSRDWDCRILGPSGTDGK